MRLERLVDALRDVGRLLVERHHHAAGLRVEPVLGARVADVGEIRSRTSAGMSSCVVVVISPATTTRPVVISVSQATRPIGSSAQDGVEDGVRDLVGDLVRMTLGHRLGRELELAGGAVVRGHALPLESGSSARARACADGGQRSRWSLSPSRARFSLDEREWLGCVERRERPDPERPAGSAPAKPRNALAHEGSGRAQRCGERIAVAGGLAGVPTARDCRIAGDHAPDVTLIRREPLKRSVAPMWLCSGP